jgi:hypothetical protein
MSQFNTSPFKTFVAGADLSAAKYHFVKLDTGKVVVATAGTDKILGVLYSTGTLDQPVTVQLYGTAKVKASTSISAGAYITATTGGKAVTTTTAGNVVRGTALQAATNTDDIIEVDLAYFHHKA